MTHSSCISCGMPLRAAPDHAAGDPAKTYCATCARPDGSMKSYDEVHAGMTAFLVATQGMNRSVAASMATTMLATKPAWADTRR